MLSSICRSSALVLITAAAGWTADSSVHQPAVAGDGINAVPADYQGKPFAGAIATIPGDIIAVAYDVAPDHANDITFHYNGGGKKGMFRSTEDCIGIGAFGPDHVTVKGEPESKGQFYLGWTQTGQWMKYTVRVAESGTYRCSGHFAAGHTGAKLSIAFAPDRTLTGEIPTTAGFQPGVEVYHVWEVSDLGELTLPAGTYVMTVSIDAVAGINIERYTMTKKP